MRKFIFIDEFGDTGIQNESSSDYFGICVLEISTKNLGKIFSEFNNFRYWTNFSNELKKVGNRTASEKLSELINILIQEKFINFTTGYFYKKNYKGPYYQKEFHDSKKLRNFSIRLCLERHFKNFSSKNEEVELIFDRYDTSSKYQENLKEYLEGNKKLPNFSEIVQIDSSICEMLQVVDLLSRILKKETKKFTEISQKFSNSIFEIKGKY